MMIIVFDYQIICLSIINKNIISNYYTNDYFNLFFVIQYIEEKENVTNSVIKILI